MRRRPFTLGALTLASALVLTACGGGGSGGGSGSGGTSGGGQPAAAPALEGVGPITLVSGKDASGLTPKLLKQWNDSHPNEKVTFIELPADADAQRQQMIQNAQAKSDAYDVLDVDNVWTAEFAANRYIVELPQDQFPLGEMLPVTVDAAKYRDKMYVVPGTSDGALLYYRTDLLKAAGLSEPPKTFAEMFAACDALKGKPEGSGVNCFAGQYKKYEGLTVNAAEAVNSAGGVFVDDSGKPNVNTPEAKAGLDTLVKAFNDGYIAKEAITYQEEEGRRAFQAGKLFFHRQWPYQYSLASKDDGSSKVAGKFAVSPMPSVVEGKPYVSSLGGHAFGISAYSKNKKTALEFIKFWSSKDLNTQNLKERSLAPVYTALYEDAALQKEFPYLSTLRDSILNAKPRPKVVRYGDATLAIQDAASNALQGKAATDAALAELQTKLEQLTAGQPG